MDKDIKEGSRVNVNYVGIVGCVTPTEAYITDSAGGTHYYPVDVYKDFTTANPENWPPRINDVWQDENGKIYHLLIGGFWVAGEGTSGISIDTWLKDHPEGKMLFRANKYPD